METNAGKDVGKWKTSNTLLVGMYNDTATGVIQNKTKAKLMTIDQPTSGTLSDRLYNLGECIQRNPCSYTMGVLTHNVYGCSTHNSQDMEPA